MFATSCRSSPGGRKGVAVQFRRDSYSCGIDARPSITSDKVEALSIAVRHSFHCRLEEVVLDRPIVAFLEGN